MYYNLIQESNFKDYIRDYISDLEKDKELFLASQDRESGINESDYLRRYTDKYGEEMVQTLNLSAFISKINQTIGAFPTISQQVLGKMWDTYLNSALGRPLIDRDSLQDLPLEPDDEKSIIPGELFYREKYQIQVDLLKMQEWIKREGKKLIIVFEGRDGAGKGSTIKRFVEYLNPRGFKVVALDKPTPEERKNWFQRYEQHFPKPGEIVFFDRSWYNRAVVEPAMGYCTEQEYLDFMNQVSGWEESLVRRGFILIKFWFSITREKQEQRFEMRKKSPLKYWKYSQNDEKAIDKYELITFYKNQMFNRTSTDRCSWVIINSNDKKVGILNAMRYVLSQVEYPDKNPEVINPYPEVVNVLKLNV